MKQLRSFITLFILILSLSLQAQSVLDSTRISGYIPVYRADETKWLQRFQHDMDKYEKENAELKDRTCDILVLGSSSVNLWHNIHNDLAPLKILRRSFGGSTIRDNIYNYNTIARGYQPRKIAFYIENDLGKGKTSISPGELYDLFRIFIQMLQRDYPETPIYIIALKPSFAKQDQIPDQLIINSLLADYAKRTPLVNFLDITPPMYDAQGNLREDIFIEDRLHMNQKGYDLWTAIIKPALMEGIYQ